MLHDLENYETSPLFTKKEKAALAYAKEMTTTPHQVNDKTRAELKLHFPENEIIELTAFISFQNCSSRFNSALNIAPQGFLKPDKT